MRNILSKQPFTLAELFTITSISNSDRTCSHGEVRLVNITASYEGHLEVCIAGKWSGVCTDGSNQEPTVACRQLGCGSGISMPSIRSNVYTVSII